MGFHTAEKRGHLMAETGGCRRDVFTCAGESIFGWIAWVKLRDRWFHLACLCDCNGRWDIRSILFSSYIAMWLVADAVDAVDVCGIHTRKCRSRHSGVAPRAHRNRFSCTQAGCLAEMRMVRYAMTNEQEGTICYFMSLFVRG